MAKIINLKAMDTISDALKNAPEKILPILTRAMTLITRTVQANIAEYPPATDANRPGRANAAGEPLGYYERGRGWWYPVMREKTLGGNLGVLFGAELTSGAGKRYKIKSIRTKAVGYKLANGGTSEMLGRSWDSRIETTDNYVLGVISNNTSYAPYVQGDEQAAIHAARGWQTIDNAIIVSMPEIERLLDEAVDEYLNSQFE